MGLCFGIRVSSLYEVLWIMRDSQKKAALLCVLAFLFGLLLTVGCATTTTTKGKLFQSEIEVGVGAYAIEK